MRKVRFCLDGDWVQMVLGGFLRFGGAFVFVVPWMYQEMLFFTQFPCGVPYFPVEESRQRRCAWSHPCMILLEQGTKWWFIALRLKVVCAFCVGSLRFAPAPSPIGCAWGGRR